MLTLKNFVVGLSIWLWWLIAWIAGLLLGLLLTFVIFTLMKSILHDLSPQTYTYVAFPFVGLTLGFSQWFLIRRYLPRAKRWILANTLSYSLSMFLLILLDPFFEAMTDYRDYIGFVVVGIASLLLWLVIRRRFTRSLGWTLVSGIGLAIFFYAIRIVGYDLGQASGIYIVGDSLTFAFSIGIPSGVVSGILMVLLLGPVLSRDSYLVEGLARLSEVSRFSTRPDIEVGDAPATKPSFTKLILVKIGLPLLVIGVLVLILVIIGPSFPQS
jgi:hypothetical protein